MLAAVKTQTISKPMTWLGVIVALVVLWWLSYRSGSKARSEKINRESRIKQRKLQEAANEVHTRMANASDDTIRDWLK
jgi:type II secretory pathway component PulM